jgi:hypothetical protein
METITINGKEYVSKQDYDNKPSGNSEPKLSFDLKAVLMDEANVLGVGSAKVGSQCIHVRLSTEYIERVIKCLKDMSLDKKGLESVDLVWADDYPVVIGRYDEKTKYVSGFILAPRVGIDKS